jgi:hypothetical protein
MNVYYVDVSIWKMADLDEVKYTLQLRLPTFKFSAPFANTALRLLAMLESMISNSAGS